MSELDALLEGDVIEDEATVETEQESAPQQQSEAQTETESATTAQPQSDDTANDPEAKNLDWAKVAYMDEKRKRQELEKRLEALEVGSNQQERPKGPDLFENPDEYMHERELKLKADISREMLIEVKPDYKEREDEFLALAKEDPTLVVKLRKAPNPAKFAYETAVKHKALQEIGDPASYREKIRAELLAELTKSQPRNKPSLANTTSVGGGMATSGDASLADILGR
jgi:predicted protein tyrosine phosphatase